MANICPICNNELRKYGKDFYVCEVCETYFDKNETIVLTEQEWLQTCDTEQLTDIFMRFMFDAEFKARFVNGNFINEFREWLKQPHTNE